MAISLYGDVIKKDGKLWIERYIDRFCREDNRLYDDYKLLDTVGKIYTRSGIHKLLFQVPDNFQVGERVSISVDEDGIVTVI